MAKNWMMFEVVDELKKGTDKAAIADIGKRYPLVARLVSIALSDNTDAVSELLNAYPDSISARKVNNNLSDGIEDIQEETVNDEVEPEEEEKPKKERKHKKSKKDKKAKVVEPEEDEDEEEEEAPKPKKEKKGKKAKKSKKAKDEEEDDDDDDDFDFDFDE